MFTDYNVNYSPLIYKICPDGLTEVISLNDTEAILYQKVQACGVLGLEEALNLDNIYIDQFHKNLIVNQFEKVNSIKIINLHGQTIKTINSVSSQPISVDVLTTGIYLFQFETEKGPAIKKFYIN